MFTLNLKSFILNLKSFSFRNITQQIPICLYVTLLHIIWYVYLIKDNRQYKFYLFSFVCLLTIIYKLGELHNTFLYWLIRMAYYTFSQLILYNRLSIEKFPVSIKVIRLHKFETILFKIIIFHNYVLVTMMFQSFKTNQILLGWLF